MTKLPRDISRKAVAALSAVFLVATSVHSSHLHTPLAHGDGSESFAARPLPHDRGDIGPRPGAGRVAHGDCLACLVLHGGLDLPWPSAPQPAPDLAWSPGPGGSVRPYAGPDLRLPQPRAPPDPLLAV